MQRGVLAVVCALVLGVYGYTAHSGFVVSSDLNAAYDYYNLLVRGFRAGQLNLKTEVPPGLAQLADPYEPAAHAPYPVLDMSYYKGKLYLYYGVTPAVLLFWPYAALTGHYLSQKHATVVFCIVGYFASVGLLWALWRRYFANVSVWAVAGGTLALGLATCAPGLLARCDVLEVPISCGYALAMLALAAVWKSLHESRTRSGWLAMASLAYGLAVGARPSLCFGAVVLLVPVLRARRERRWVWKLLLAATMPITLIGLGLMLYNASRFDNPFVFGWRYQLAADPQLRLQPFSLRYLWLNFRVYFLESGRWSGRFPFLHDIRVPPLPAGHGVVEHAFGVLTNVPLVWLALAAPLGWRGRSAGTRSTLCGFLVPVCVLFGTSALTLSLFFAASIRYQVEFVPALVLLAAMGILSLERALAPTSESGQAARPVWRRAARCCWSLQLCLSVAFSLLASVLRCAEAHNNLGMALQEAGRMPEAMGQYQEALGLEPDFAEARNNLGVAMTGRGRTQEAIGQYEQALHLKPDFAGAHYNLGVVLMGRERTQEAIGHFRQALRLKPNYPEALYNWGLALARTGHTQEAIEHWEQALRIKPDFADVHYNLGVAFEKLGRTQEAIQHYEQAVSIKPDSAQAQRILGNALLQVGNVQEAIKHFEQALHIKPDYAEAYYDLGVALEELGRIPEAIEHYEQALWIEPDFIQAKNALARARAIQ